MLRHSCLQKGPWGCCPWPGAAARHFAEGEAGGSLQHGPSCSPEPAAGFLGQPRAGGTGLLPGSCSHELSDGPDPGAWCAALPGLCSVSVGSGFPSHTRRCFGTFLPPFLSLLKKPISVPGGCWWEELGTQRAPGALCKSRAFFRR